MKDLKFAILYDFYNHFLTEKQIEVIEMYYDQDLSLGEIGENLGITRQGVRDNIKRAEGLLLEFEEKIGAAKRYQESIDLINNIQKSVDSIADMAYSTGQLGIYDEVKKIRDYLEEARHGI